MPSTIATAGTSPASRLLRTSWIVENPWARTSTAPTAAVSTTRPMVGTAPITPPTWSSSQISTRGTAMNSRRSR